eukprot:3380161-Rhodomonas_salina.1
MSTLKSPTHVDAQSPTDVSEDRQASVTWKHICDMEGAVTWKQMGLSAPASSHGNEWMSASPSSM